MQLTMANRNRQNKYPKVRDINKIDDIAKYVGISLSQLNFILNPISKVQKHSA